MTVRCVHSRSPLRFRSVQARTLVGAAHTATSHAPDALAGARAMPLARAISDRRSRAPRTLESPLRAARLRPAQCSAHMRTFPHDRSAHLAQ